jgi:hypothetical protein
MFMAIRRQSLRERLSALARWTKGSEAVGEVV